MHSQSFDYLFGSEAIHVCNLITNTVLSMGLSTPTTGDYQKYFLIITNHYCQLEVTFDSSERSNFGIRLAFKNDKQCRRSDWLFPKTDKRSHFQCGFGLKSGLSGSEEWTDNKIGFVSVWTNQIQYSILPMDTEDLTPTQPLNTIDFDMKRFVPTIAYNVFSRQDLNSIVFFEQKQNSQSNKYDLRAQVFNFENDNYFNYTDFALQELQQFESPDITLRRRPNKPMTRQWSRVNSRFIPKAVLKTDRSMRIVGLYGLRLPKERADPFGIGPNGTIIVFKKMGPNGFQTYWYCVTDEYELADDVSISDQTSGPDCCHSVLFQCRSSKHYKLLIDCNNETFADERDSLGQSFTSDETQITPIEERVTHSYDKGKAVHNTNNTNHNSGTLFWIVISILSIIVVVLVIFSLIFSSDPWADDYYRKLKKSEGQQTAVKPEMSGKSERSGIDRSNRYH